MTRGEQRAQLDTLRRSHLQSTYGSHEFQRDAATDSFLTSRGCPYKPGEVEYEVLFEASEKSFERVRREQVYGEERYLYTQGRGEGASYQEPVGISVEINRQRRNTYLATAAGLLRLAHTHHALLANQGVTEEAEVESLQEIIDALA